MTEVVTPTTAPAEAVPDRLGQRPVPALRRRIGPVLAVAPFFFIVTLGLILPTLALAVGAFQRTDPDTQVTESTMDNMAGALRGGYRTALLGSLRLAAICAVIGSVLGVLLAAAVVRSGSPLLRRLVLTASGVLANFGGVPLAFAFVASIGNAGVVTTFLNDHFGFSLQSDLHFQLATITGIALVYMYFLVPLMVLVMTPALEGLKPQWAEAAENLGASRWHYWRFVAGPVLLPNFLGSVLLLFCSSFSAYATANALAGQSFPLVPTQIASVLSGNVLSGQENLGAALALDMIVVVLPLTVVYQLLQRRTSRWLS